ncbi:MAG: hypothetical protein ABFD52_05450 [Acidobacteriota bacterium]
MTGKKRLGLLIILVGVGLPLSTYFFQENGKIKLAFHIRKVERKLNSKEIGILNELTIPRDRISNLILYLRAPLVRGSYAASPRTFFKMEPNRDSYNYWKKKFSDLSYDEYISALKGEKREREILQELEDAYPLKALLDEEQIRDLSKIEELLEELKKNEMKDVWVMQDRVAYIPYKPIVGIGIILLFVGLGCFFLRR